MVNFSEFTNSAPVVLAVFYAPWCPHCKRMHTTVADAVELLEGRVPVERFNIDEWPEAAASEKVESVPTFIAYRDGRQVWRHKGVISGDALLGKIEGLLSG